MSEQHNVTLTPVTQNGQISWEMQYGSKKGNGPDSYPPIVIPHGSKNTKIEFTINDPGNITFVPVDQKPIYIQEIDPAEPQTKPVKGVVNYQFKVEKVSQDGKTLTIKDKNGSAKTYSYELNFNNAPPLDPIIQNGGGGGGNQFYDWIAANPVIAGAAAVLLLALLAALLRSRMVRSKPAAKGAGEG